MKKSGNPGCPGNGRPGMNPLLSGLFAAGNELSFPGTFAKSSESVQCAMLKPCDACADMGQL